MSFYCSEKFTFLTVDVEKRLLYSCCSAKPEKINLTWLKENPTQLFNTSLIQSERQDMLNNIPVASCEANCWRPEKNNLTSRRIWLKKDQVTHTNVQTTSPSLLNINLGSSCNLTCSYCCKQYSSAWRQDIVTNGSYINHERFNVTSQDRILLKISQAEHIDTAAHQQIVDAISNFDKVKEISISGGEPFLYNSLISLLEKFNNIDIQIYTGLGVNPTRFKKQLSKIKNKHNLTIVVSAENCDSFYEFNRYGNTWSQFLINLTELQNEGFSIKFSSVISNLTIFGLLDFINQFPKIESRYNWCNDPDFLGVNVLDDLSKEDLIHKISSSDIQIKEYLISSIKQSYTEEQKQNFSMYLSEFARRKNLSLAIYPASMLQWLKVKGF
jgi:organic radical activating enzyme